MTAPVLLLASTSPRRRELLTAAGVGFLLCEPGPEPDAHGAPPELARARARSKAVHAIVPAGHRLPVLGVDTVVDVDGREFGKADDRTTAAALLRQLLSRTHRVHTAHCLYDPTTGRTLEEVATSTVVGTAADERQLQRYLDSGDWRTKAGAYGIQDATQDFLRLAAGAFDTVVGLHVPAVLRLLASWRGDGGA